MALLLSISDYAVSRSRLVKHLRSIAAIIIFMIVAFAIKDKIIYSSADRQMELRVNSMNSLDAVEDKDGTEYTVTGEDPYIVLDGMQGRLDDICMTIDDEDSDQLQLQVFYAKNGQKFSAENCTTQVVTPDDGKVVCDIPDGEYTALRIDFEQNLRIKNIIARGYSHIDYMILVVYLIICAGICLVLWLYTGKFLDFVDEKLDFVYNFCVDKKIRCWHVFVVLAIVIGTIYSFIIPPLQVPDEQAHVAFMEQELGMTGVSQAIGQYYSESGMGDLPTHYDMKVNDNTFAQHKTDRFDKNTISWVSAPSILLIRHLPSAIGLLLGILFNMPIYYCLTMAEIFALLFYVFVSYWALKIMPIKREFFMAVMLLPMTLQQCASLNYDAMVIPMSFLMLAICFDCIYGKRKVNWKTVIQLLLITGVIVVIKIPYILILLVMFLVPREKWNLKIKNWDIIDTIVRFWPIVIVFGIAVVVAGMYLFRHNFFVEIMLACAYDIKHYVHIIYNTLMQYGRFYVMSSIGVFGWLETPMPSMFFSLVIAFLLFLAMQSDAEECSVRVRWFQRLVCFGIFVVITVFLITALLSWNFKLDGIDVYTLSFDGFVNGIKNYDVTLGIQGRYFIPLIFFLGIPVHGIYRVKKSHMALVQGVYYIIMTVWTIDVLMLRYWC